MAGNNRQANIEVMRIIAMLFIITWHSILYSGERIFTFADTPASYLSINIIAPIAISMVNIFILITGYFLVDKVADAYPWRKMVKLWTMVEFYSTVLFAICVLFLHYGVSRDTICENLFPVYNNRWWFVTEYISLYALSPFLARFARTMNKKNYSIFLTIFLMLSFTYLKDEFVNGFSLFWFICLFFAGGYIKRFDPFKASKSVYAAVFAVGALAFCIILLSTPLDGKINITADYGIYNNPFIFIASVAFFMLFRDIKFGERTSKAIMSISPLMFGVYIIHEHRVVVRFLWEKVNNHSDSLNMLILAGISVGIFIVCCIIEKLRLALFRLCPFDKYLCSGIEAIYNKISTALSGKK